MNSLGPGGHFKPVVNQVESSACLSIRVRHGIERLQLQRPVDHEEGLLPYKSSKLPLLGLRKIHPVLYLFTTLPKQIHRLKVLNSLQRQTQRFQILAQPFQLLTARLVHGLDAVSHEFLQDLHHIRIGRERFFNVHLPHLVQMGRLLELLSPEYRKNSEDLLKRYRAHLLVQLRRLGQIRLLLEILQREQLRTTLARGRYDHRRLNLHVVTLKKELPERLEDFRLDLEDSIRLLTPKIQDPPVEPRLQQRILNPPRVQGQRSLSPAHNLQLTRNNLNPPLRNLTRNNHPTHKQHILLVQTRDLLQDLSRSLRLGSRHLNNTTHVPQKQEGDSSKDPDVVDPACQDHFLVQALSELRGEMGPLQT